ncbi:hypothetical protein D3C76_1873070 [compost metagenome]
MYTARAKLETFYQGPVLEKELVALIARVSPVAVFRIDVRGHDVASVKWLPLECATNDVALFHL